MGDPVLFRRERGLTLEQIAALTGAHPQSGRDLIIRDAISLDFAGPEDITFADRHSDTAALAITQAGACFVTSDLVRALSARATALVIGDPYRAFVQVANALYPTALRPSSLFEVGARSASATVHPTARVEPNVTIDPGAMIGPRAEIGSGTMVGPMTVIGPDVRIGRDCAIGPGASVLNALIGDRVVVRSGCRLGDENPTGAAPADRRVAQFGRVILQDGVQLGANCTIDRGSYLDTVVGEHTLIDNLVRIPANISIGRHCRISLLHGSKTSAAELLSGGVVPDHTATDARSIASFGSR